MTAEPFFIVPKSAHAAILAKVEGNNVAYCVAIFDALRKLANDAGCADGPVALRINEIAAAVGCGYRKAFDVLRVLRAIGVINVATQRIAGTKSFAPSAYSFPTLCTIDRTLCTARTRSRAEIYKGKNRKEQKEPDPCAGPASPSVASKESTKQNHPRSPKPIKVMNRNLLLDTLAGLDGSDLAQVTRYGWAGTAKALAAIKEVCPGVTPDEIRRRAGNYKLHFRDATISPHALAKWWGRCDRGPAGAASEPVRLGSNLEAGPRPPKQPLMR